MAFGRMPPPGGAYTTHYGYSYLLPDIHLKISKPNSGNPLKVIMRKSKSQTQLGSSYLLGGRTIWESFASTGL